MKKTIINILYIFLQTCLIASEAELAEVEDETRVEYGKNVFELAKTNKASLPFLDYLLTHVFKAHKPNFRRGCYSKEDYYQNLHGIHCAGTDLIVNAAEPVQSPIPKITHTILIKERETDEPLLNETQKGSFSKLIKALPVTSGWRHLLWVLDPGTILPQDLEGVAENTENIELMPIFSMNNSCINDLISAGKNDHAIAFLGYEILNTHGGITRTIDKPVNGNIALFCSTFSFLAELDNDTARVIDPSFLASTPHHPIINRALELARYHSDPDKARYCSYLQKLPNDPLAELHVKYGNGPISIAFHQHAVAERDMVLCYGGISRRDIEKKNSLKLTKESCTGLAVFPSKDILKINKANGKLAFKESFTTTFPNVQEQFRLLGGSFRYMDTSALPGNCVHNPSLISFNEKLFMTLRVQGHKGNSAWYAETFFAEVDENFTISRFSPLIADSSKTHEDARLIIKGDSLFVSYVSDVSYKHGYYCTCVEASSFLPWQLIESPIRPDIDNNKHQDCLQKNWIFFEKDRQFILIDNIDPMSVWDATEDLENPTKICQKDKVLQDWRYGQPRSSTTPIYLEQYSKWITFFHSHLLTSDGIRVYFLGALLFDNDFNINGYTDTPLFVSSPEPTRFLGANTILPYGCLLKGNDLIMSIGVNDMRAGIGVLPLDSVLRLIKT